VKCSKDKLGLYLHVPFCLSKCKYCHFYSENISNFQSFKELYWKSLKRELEFFKDFNFTFETLYVGGGTPNSIPVSFLARILELVHSQLNLGKVIEKSIELNPERINKSLLDLLKAFGFNRISIGVQSFVDHELRLLGRRHTAKDAERAIKFCQDQGIENINIDLLFAFKGQTQKTWEFTIHKAIQMDVKHISTYSMTYEKGALENLVNYNPDTFVKLFKIKDKLLKSNHFRRYEISNYAKRGYECLHNLKYWLRHYYLGLGPSASGFYRAESEIRYTNPANIKDYAQGKKWVEVLTEEKALTEEIFLRIRTIYGWKADKDFLELAKSHLGPLISVKNNALKLSEKGVLVADSVTLKILELYEDYRQRT